jgi:acetolactate synthase-1/2/3 large subunit
MTNEKNNQPTGADIVVMTLEQHEVKWVFGLPGAKIDKVFNTLVNSSIQTVVCRHEQNAAFIAGGIGRMTGKAGVTIATSGPGVSNLVTGLATANAEGDRVLALGGAVPLADRLKKIHPRCKPDSPHCPSPLVTGMLGLAVIAHANAEQQREQSRANH